VREHPEESVRGPIFGLGCLRFSTASCCRSTKFSKSSVRCERKQRASSPNHSRKKRNMENSHSKLAVEESVQAVDFTVGQNFGE